MLLFCVKTIVSDSLSMINSGTAMFKSCFWMSLLVASLGMLASFLNIRELQYPFAACLIFVVIAASIGHLAMSLNVNKDSLQLI